MQTMEMLTIVYFPVRREATNPATASLMKTAHDGGRCSSYCSKRQTRSLEQILDELRAMSSSREDRAGPRTNGTTAEVAALLRYDAKWVRKHGEALGGWKKPGRGGRWKFPLDGIEERARELTSRKPPAPPEPQPPTSAAGDQTIDLTPRPRM